MPEQRVRVNAGKGAKAEGIWTLRPRSAFAAASPARSLPFVTSERRYAKAEQKRTRIPSKGGRRAAKCYAFDNAAKEERRSVQQYARYGITTGAKRLRNRRTSNRPDRVG